MSHAQTTVSPTRRRFSMFKHADDLALIAASRRFACQRESMEALFDRYQPFDPPAKLLAAMHDALDDRVAEVAAIAATTRDGLRLKAALLLEWIDDRGVENTENLTRSLVRDVLAL